MNCSLKGHPWLNQTFAGLKKNCITPQLVNHVRVNGLPADVFAKWCNTTKRLRDCLIGVGRASWVVGRASWVVGRGSWVVGRGSWVVGRGSCVVGRGSCVYKPSYQLSLDFKFTEKCVTQGRKFELTHSKTSDGGVTIYVA